MRLTTLPYLVIQCVNSVCVREDQNAVGVAPCFDQIACY